MKNQEEFKRDNLEETKKGMKEINKIIFANNEDIPDDWTDFQLTPEEVKILKEGERYIEKELIPSLSGYRKDPKTKKENLEIKKENIRLSAEEMLEIDSLLKEKTKSLKFKEENDAKKKTLKAKEEEEKKKREIDIIND